MLRVALFGFNQSELEAAASRAYRNGREEARKELTDRSGRSANEVWMHWIRTELRAGNKPPFGAPDDLIDQAREDLQRKQPGIDPKRVERAAEALRKHGAGNEYAHVLARAALEA